MTNVAEIQVSDSQLAKYATLIYEVTGNRVSPQKKALLSNRLRRRLRETGQPDFDAYYKYLRGLPLTHAEWDAFLQEITTHETYLFRDEVHWQWFQMNFLPEIANLTRAGKRTRSLRVWSAACSTGDEATTIATCIASVLTNHSQWQVRILGTDIGIGAVEQARKGQFCERAMRNVPATLRSRYFQFVENQKLWQAKPTLTSMMEFRQHNLLEPLREKPFDLVFLKNVLIYFDAASKTQVIDNMRQVMPVGGLVVAGAAEGISDLLQGFQRLQPWLYRKQ